MPNVRGLVPAPDVLKVVLPGAHAPFGPHATVIHDGTNVGLWNLPVLNDEGVEILPAVLVASVNFSGQKPRARANLSLIDGNTVTAVNALLRPYGKVKQYWRTGEYRWHPLTGQPSPVKRPVTSAQPSPVKSAPAPVAAPAVPAIVAPAPVATVHPATYPVIETMKRWQDRGGKQPVVKQMTALYSIVDGIVVPTQSIEDFDFMLRQRQTGVPAFGLITGPAGTAKTSIAQAWAFSHDMPVVIVEGQSIQTASDWFGSLVPNTEPGGAPFVWEWSDAAKLINTGLPCTIVLDELNRPENERALNGIMGLTDWKATVKHPGMPHAVVLKPGQCIIATLNEGPEYVGTVEVDVAVRDRFDAACVAMTYPPEVVEAKILVNFTGIEKDVAKRLVRIAGSQRAKRDDDLLYPSHNVLSTRALVTIARSIALGRDPKAAIWATARGRFIPEDFDALNALVEAQFGPNPAAPAGSDEDVEQMMAAHGF